MMDPRQNTRPPLPRATHHPLWWSALALLLLNDHALKGAGLLPGWMTGKLSDAAGLIVLSPLLAWALSWGLGPQRRASRPLAVALTGGALALVNLSPALASVVELALGAIGLPSRIWVDPSDLLMLPALLLAWPLCLPQAPGAEPPPRRLGPSSARRLQQAGLALAALACIATSSDGGDDDDGIGDGAAIENRSGAPITVLIASTEAAGGCRLYREDRIAALTADAFALRREVTIADGERVALSQDAPIECGAAWVQLSDGDEIFLFWRDLDPLDGYVPEDDASRRARVLTVDGDEGRYTTDLGDDLFRFELGDTPPEPSCEEPEASAPIEFSFPAVGQGFFELDEVRDLGDGCLELDWISQADDTAPLDTQRLCVPDWAFPFEARDVLSVLVAQVPGGGARLQISRYEDGEIALQLVVFMDAGADPLLLGDSPVESLAADDCFGRLSECGAYLRPAELELELDDSPLRAGDEAEYDHGEPESLRVLVSAAQWVDWTSSTCEGVEARVGPSASWLELREF